MRKQWIAAMIIGIFCFMAFTAQAAARYKDLSGSDTFYDEILYLADKEIISGFPDGTFRSKAPVTRAQAAIMIGRALDVDGTAKDTKFPDVTADVTGSGYIAAMVEKEIITGFPDGTYRPHEPVTRGQMAIFIDRAFALEPCKCANPFSDVSWNQAAFASIVNAYFNGIVNGYPDGTYRSAAEVTRGQFSAFLARALEVSFRGKPITFAVESISGWKPGDAAPTVDIDQGWVIQFTDTIAWDYSLRDHLTIVREKDQKPLYFEIDRVEPKTLKLLLGELYQSDETYYLTISDKLKSKMGAPLAQPVQMKFHAKHPDFTVEKTIEQEGVRMEVKFAKSGEKVFAKLKATNISNEDIPYVSAHGCDPGIAAHLVDEESERVGGKWGTALGCHQAVMDYTLKPGKSVEAMEVLYLPEESNGELFVEAVFQQGSAYGQSTRKPIRLMIPLEEIIQTTE